MSDEEKSVLPSTPNADSFQQARVIANLDKEHEIPQIVIGERQYIRVPDAYYQPEYLVGFMRNVHFDTQANRGSADSMEGITGSHTTIREADSRQRGVPNPKSYDEPIRVDGHEFVGQVKFDISHGDYNFVGFQLIIDSPVTDATRALIHGLITAWAPEHASQLDNVPPEATISILHSESYVYSHSRTTNIYAIELGKLWHDGQLDQEVLRQLLESEPKG